MIKNLRKVAVSLVLGITIVAQAGNVSAASVKFGTFTWTTTSRDEALFAATQKRKADNEKNWYLTLTTSKGLSKRSGSNKNGRALAYSAINSNLGAGGPVPLFKDVNKNNTTVTYPYSSYERSVKKGALGTLYLGGNSNNTKTYTITLAGRYTS